MNRITLAVSVLTLVSQFVISSTLAGDRVNARQHRQRERIAEGVKSGELSQEETKKLRREERRIRKAEHRMRKDGELDAGEKAKLEKMQDKASKDIYELKHNEEKRPEPTAQPQQ